MEYWEFLLQQEGDSSWLPLDTSQMEILEGRYRIMAHCSQPNAPVQIHISQVAVDQTPPKRRSLKRQGQTNENGLLVVLPFTRLAPGTWNIYCQEPDHEEDSEPQATPPAEGDFSPWRYAIQLRVLPQGIGEDGDWFADDGSAHSLAPGTTSTGVTQAAANSNPLPGVGSPVTAGAGASGAASPASTSWSDAELQDILRVFDQAQQGLTDPDQEGSTLYPLTLEQTAFMATQGQSIHLTGQANSVIEGESCSDMSLVVRLCDPQTAEVIALVPFELGARSFPAEFAVAVTLPHTLSTRLLLGELALLSRQAGAFNLLALQRFTVTIDLAALFDEIANRAETEADADLIFAPDRLAGEARADLPGGSPEGDPSSWDDVRFPVAPPRSVPAITLPRSHPTIPPKIYYPSPHEVSARKPVLPPLGQPKPASTPQGDPQTPASDPADLDAAAAPGNPDAEDTSAPQPPDASESTAARSPQGLSLPPLQSPTPEPSSPPGSSVGASSATAPHRHAVRPSSGRDAEADPLMLPSHETMAFKALNLQERFWSRLNDLAATIQQEAQEARRGPVEAAPLGQPEGEEGDEPVFIPFAGEVVIYEDPEPPAEEITPAAAAALVDRLQEDDDAELLNPPVPEIDMATTELIAKETVLLTLRVPYHPNRMYLKVWITDPQTRSLTDEPRQITHLVPNGHGQLEGSVQLTVPMGCLEIWIEAISVDMVTQQESYKASVSRAVNPLGADAAAESASLDDFDL